MIDHKAFILFVLFTIGNPLTIFASGSNKPKSINKHENSIKRMMLYKSQSGQSPLELRLLKFAKTRNLEDSENHVNLMLFLPRKHTPVK